LSTVCIIDDDDAVRDSLRTLLESHAFSVCEFSSAEDLLSASDIDDLDCFVVDFHMRGMNGLEMLETLRDRGISRAALIVSALSLHATQERMRRAGVIAALTKPVSETDLIAWIHRALDGAASAIR
jgi:two-component system response regulator FixJ